MVATGGATNPISVVLVDGHAIFRHGLADLLDSVDGITVLGEAENARQAVERAGELSPDIVLMAVRLPGTSGIKATGEVLAASPASRVVMLTASKELSDAERSIVAGASGYVLKQAPIEEIATAIRAAAAGHSPLSPAIASGMLERIRVEEREQDITLTDREGAVLELMVGGRSNPEIAAELEISVQTVKGHVSRLLEKLEAENRTQAAVAAVRRGLV
jgi:DNA-binding NarL/FixJ family response regulator